MDTESYYEFISRSDNKTFLERMFMKRLVEVYSDQIIPFAFRGDLEEPQIDPITKNRYYIDFFIRTPDAEYCIETDGAFYHDQTCVPEERYTRLVEKTNYIMDKWGNKAVCFTKEHLDDPNLDYVIKKLAQKTVGDPTLNKLRLGFRLGSNEIEPNPIQKEGLSILELARKKNNKTALCVMPTGIGKTYFAALDVQSFSPKKCLFIVHRNEILDKSMSSFKSVLGGSETDYGFFNAEKKDIECRYIFASVASLTNNLENYFSREEFDYIVVDETHHSAAPSWEKIHSFFTPKFLLGLTATPDRLDKKSILEIYGLKKPTYEISRKECISRGYLAPFTYIAKRDNVNYEGIFYSGRKYDVNDLNKKLMVPKRDKLILEEYKNLKLYQNINPRKPKEYLHSEYKKHSIGFCPSIEYADYLTELFNNNGIKAVSIHSKMMGDRETIIKDFNNNKYEIAFTRDLFNEGVDFPSVNTLLMLRPSESQTIMTQQLGRGIRVYGGKFMTMVLDFIGKKEVKERLDGLGIKRDDFDVPEKEEYIWDADGQTIIFDEEIIEEYDISLAREEPIKEDEVDIFWRNYRDFVGQRGEENLYAKTGNQNSDISVAMQGINVIYTNPQISSTNFDKELKKISQETEAGARVLNLAKVIGLIVGRNKNYEIHPFFQDILKKTNGDLTSPNQYLDETTTQSEKMFYFNSIAGFSKTNKWQKHDDRADYTQMKIYPIFAIYQILIGLYQKGYSPGISMDEYKFFCSFLLNNEQDIDNAQDKIIEFRSLSELDRIKVLNLFQQTLKGRKNIDTRIKKVLVLNKYIEITDDSIINIKSDYIELIEKKVETFEKIINSNKLIQFDEDKPELYKSLLFSKSDLLSYHLNN